MPEIPLSARSKNCPFRRCVLQFPANVHLRVAQRAGNPVHVIMKAGNRDVALRPDLAEGIAKFGRRDPVAPPDARPFIFRRGTECYGRTLTRSDVPDRTERKDAIVSTHERQPSSSYSAPRPLRHLRRPDSYPCGGRRTPEYRRASDPVIEQYCLYGRSVLLEISSAFRLPVLGSMSHHTGWPPV